MAFAANQKRVVISTLQDTYRAAQEIELLLRMKKKHDEADAVWEAASRLHHEIDVLIGRAMNKWTADAGAVITDLGKAKSDVQGAITELQNDIGIAKKVVTAVGFIDEAIAIAKKLIAAM